MIDPGSLADLSEQRARDFDLDAEDRAPVPGEAAGDAAAEVLAEVEVGGLEPPPAPTCSFPGFTAPDPARHARAAPAGRPAPQQVVGSKQHVVDTLLAALKLSGVPAFADEETYRYLLTSWFTRYYDGRVLDLQLVWNSLIGGEDVSRDQAALPLALLEAGQPEHGLALRLPEEMLASECLPEIRRGAIALLEAAGGFRAAAGRVMAPVEPVAAGPVEARARKARAEGEGRARGPRVQPRAARPPASFRKLFGVVVLALAGVCVALLQPLGLWDRTRSVDLKETSALIKLGAGLQQADLLVATVLDPGWSDWEPDQRRERVRLVARSLAGRGVRRLNLVDATDSSVAFASLAADGSGDFHVRLASDPYDLPPGS
jgi:hypothetical protein